jgi:hypothetical protein
MSVCQSAFNSKAGVESLFLSYLSHAHIVHGQGACFSLSTRKSSVRNHHLATPVCVKVAGVSSDSDTSAQVHYFLTNV